eukprot:Gb_18951 [translate_table: standard]
MGGLGLAGDGASTNNGRARVEALEGIDIGGGIGGLLEASTSAAFKYLIGATIRGFIGVATRVLAREDEIGSFVGAFVNGGSIHYSFKSGLHHCCYLGSDGGDLGMEDSIDGMVVGAKVLFGQLPT